MDVVVIWNRPDVRGTVVKAVAFYDDKNCGTKPDPTTRELPIPTAILVLDVANPNSISVFNLASQNLGFLWGSYRSIDLIAERQPRRILGQFVGQDLSGTIIQRDPNPTSPDKPYKEPIRIIKTMKTEQFDPLRSTPSINALLWHVGEVSLLSVEATREPRIVQMTRMLMDRISRDLEEERVRGEAVRKGLATTSAAVGGTTDSTLRASGGPFQGPFMPQGYTNTNFDPQRKILDPVSSYDGRPRIDIPANQNMATQMSEAYHYPNSNSFPQGTSGGQLYQTYNLNPRTTGQYPTEQLQSEMLQRYSPNGNPTSPRGSMAQSNVRGFNTPPVGGARGVSPTSNIRSDYIPGAGTQQPTLLNPTSASIPGRVETVDTSRDRMITEEPATGNANQNNIPDSTTQQETRPQNTYILPSPLPMRLHPDLLQALYRGDDPRELEKRPPDTSAILQSYLAQQDKKKWLDTFIAITRSVNKVYTIAKQLYDLGERGGIPPTALVGGGQGAERMPQVQNPPPSGSVNQLPRGSQPQSNEFPQADIDSQLNRGQQPTSSNVGPGTEGHRPGEMQIEAPRQQAQAPTNGIRQPPMGYTGPGNYLPTQAQSGPENTGPQMGQTGSRGGLSTGQQMQPMQQAQPLDLNPNRSQGQGARPQTGLNTVSQEPAQQGPGNAQRLPEPSNSGRRQMITEGPGIEELSTPGVFRLSMPRNNVQQQGGREPLPQQFTVQNAPAQGILRTGNVPILTSESTIPSQREGPPRIELGQPQSNNVQWLREQLNPFERQSIPPSQGQAPSGLVSEYEQSPRAREQDQQGDQSGIPEYIPSPDAAFPDWDEDYNPLAANSLASGNNLGTGDNGTGASSNPENIPTMFQRASSPREDDIPQEGTLSRSQSNQQLFNGPSVGQLRPSPSRGLRSSPAEQAQNQESGQRRSSAPFRIERFPPRPVPVTSGSTQTLPLSQQQRATASDSDINRPSAEIIQGSVIEEEVPQESGADSELIEVNQRPEIFNREQNLGPEMILFMYSQEEVAPVSAQSVIDEVSGGSPRASAQQGNSNRQRVGPTMVLEEGLDPEFQDMVRDIIWGKQPPPDEMAQLTQANVPPPDPVITDEELLRPPPMRVPPQGLRVIKPDLTDPPIPGLNLAHEYGKILSQLRQFDNLQRQPDAQRIPGYITPKFLRSERPDPPVNPFLEEDTRPLNPSAMMRSLNPDWMKTRIWDTEYKFTDPMLDREFAQQLLQEERDRRENELFADPFKAWRSHLKSIAEFQQQKRPGPRDIPSWQGPSFLSDETAPSLDVNRVVTGEQVVNTDNAQDNDDQEWNEAEDSLVSKKRKLNPGP
ncbi:hypothetical protein TWF481_004932 [Arthrobotrys musiformis]|uniref:Uncharacterized protein n=1 Tax=Arthrobotrys musiformis TaxID=47236 RepID=A0AAV9WM31_9PEZI